MDNLDFEITLEDFEEKEKNSLNLPVNFISFGEIESGDVNVYIKQDVYNYLEQYAASDTTKELGTILLGDYCEDNSKNYVIISDYIVAKYTDASASTLTFTHKTWEYVHSQHEKNHSDKKIVGWQHTHPSYGIFLSNYDMFIQENFFNLPFQLAYVIDPIQKLRGFFQWKDGTVQKLRGYYVYDEVGKQIKSTAPKAKKDKEESKKPQKNTKNKASTIVIILLCILTALLSTTTLMLNNKLDNLSATQSVFLEKIDELSLELDTKTSQINDLTKEIENTKIQPDLTDKNTVYFEYYTVVQGDSLYQICQKHKLNYSENINIILSVNGIKNPDVISVGQKILLPVY